MKITKDTLDRYVAEGWLISQVHPTLPLTIYNYSQATQYEAKWDEVTLSCRGLVFDEAGNQVSHPFKKFFNIEENKHTPTEHFEIYEKVDGSLITVFNYNGEWVVSSRGSFTSDQAIAAQKLFKQLMNLDRIDERATYLFELIAPWNRIVVDYGEREELILLGARAKYFEASHLDLYEVAKMLGCNLIRKFDFEDYKEIQKLNWANTEGFIVRFSNGDRCKIKFADYVKLHRVLTNCSSYDIWENLKEFDKLPEEMLQDVPDEFYDWVHGVEWKLRKNYNHIENLHMAHLSSTLRYGLDRKEFALRVQELEGVNHGLIFAMYNSKQDKVKQLIWKMIKPEYEKPFSNADIT
jgi:T4 RnlA family RNA ligase